HPTPALRRWSRKGRGKRLKLDWVPMNKGLVRIFSALPSRGVSEWVFPNARGTGPLDAKKWYVRVFKPAVARAGLVDFRFHAPNHPTGSRLRQAGVPLEDIAVALQHADTRMSLRYAHMAPGRLAEVMETLSRTDPATDPGRSGSEGSAE